MTLEFVSVGVAEHPEAAHVPILDGLRAYNLPVLGNIGHVKFVVEAKDHSGTVVGGAIGGVHLGWLMVDVLWVDEAWRGKGIGSAVLAKMEQEGRDHGASRAMLDTFQFQAPEFYRRKGYVEFGRIKEFVSGNDRIYLEKQIG